MQQRRIFHRHWSFDNGNDECKSSLRYKKYICDTNLKADEHGLL